MSAPPTPPLWAPWRMEYILGPKPADKSSKAGGQLGCVFCVLEKAPEEELAKRLVVAATADTIVMLNRYPFAAGHLLVMPRAHVSDLEALDDEAHASLHRVVRDAVVRLKRAVRCEGLNVGI